MHVSPGLGTTFVPFRYFARPEATELVLRCTKNVEGHSVISSEVLARYAVDAAAEVPGVHTKQRRAARAADGEIEVHVVVDYGADIPAVAAEVQQRVLDYLERMTDVRPVAVHVVVDDVARR